MRITQGDLGQAIAALNEAAKAINLGRRYTMTPGSRTMGTSYSLQEHSPALQFPSDKYIGRTRTEAYAFINTMTYAYGQVARHHCLPQAGEDTNRLDDFLDHSAG